MPQTLEQLAKEAMDRFNALSPEEQREYRRLQRESFARGMGPCEHGDYDWETCSQCLEKYSRGN